MRFEHQEYLYWLFAIPVMIVIYILVRYLNNRKFNRFSSEEMRHYLMPLRSKTRPTLKFSLMLLVIASLIFAAANPQTGSKMKEAKREGIDLFLAVDISNSMLAEDIVPNRLSRAKQAISKLIDKLQGDRIGIIVFAGTAYVQLPITTDYSSARMFLSTLNTELINAQGTAIGAAIQTALKSFDQDERNKAIVVISDGEDHENEAAIKAAKEALDKGIYVYTIGMGLPEGTPIPIYGRNGVRTGYRKDANNTTVITRLNEKVLQQIAEAGGGVYVRASNSNVGLEQIFGEINKMEKSEIETKVFADYEDQFQWFIALALFFLLLEILLASGKKKWELKFNFFEKQDETN